jgi:hypothetical protein
MDNNALLFVIADCKAAIGANPEADKVKCGYYQDEIRVMSAELNRREQKKRGI